MAASFTNVGIARKANNHLLRLRMKTALRMFAAFGLLFVAMCLGFAQTPQSPLPKPTGYVNDYAGVVDSATKARLEKTLSHLHRQQPIKIAILTIDATG